MKILRVLTGIHAGASLELTPGSHRIGADDDADIRLTDWQGPDAVLEADPADVIRISRELPGDEEAGDVLLVDFVPMQFGETVLCIGPEDVAWPSDVDLLSTLLASPVKSQLASYQRQQRRRRQLTAVAACVVLGGVIVAGALLGMTQLSRAAFPASADDRTLRVTQALAASHVAGLHAQALGNAVVITGMVPTTNDDTAVRALLDRVSPDGIERRYDVAQDDVRSIQDSLGIPGAHVAYGGNGQFVITGNVADMHQLEAAVARVRADFDSNVKALVIQAEQSSGPAPDTPAASYSEMVSSDDVRYAETPDGVKHIFAVDAPASAATADAGSAPATANATAGGDANATAQAAPASSAQAAQAPAARGVAFPSPPDPGSLPARRDLPAG
ncbi:secretion protein [Paraburkholderia sp. B3]|uniref:secretion protein n=1 Tax=Paraburkholderia sp. B3 TaxID=3134791 RepID=UPI00398296D9